MAITSFVGAAVITSALPTSTQYTTEWSHGDQKSGQDDQNTFKSSRYDFELGTDTYKGSVIGHEQKERVSYDQVIEKPFAQWERFFLR